MFLAQVDAELLAEAALRVQSGDLDSAGLVSVFTAIARYADTVDQVASGVPVPEALSSAWDEAFQAHTETRDILSRWSDEEIDPEHVIAELEAVRQSAAHALQVAEQWIAQMFAADTTGLAAAREKALARIVDQVFEPTPEPTVTPTEPPATAAATPESILTAGERAYALAEAGVTRNADWTRYTEEIDGVLMALVPAGCFQMGSIAGNSDERPVHEVCFEGPFWIDVYEVTNEHYGSILCADFSSDPEQPRVCVSWTDAQAHCDARGARLPTEAEWEYAARGPDGLVYPWGNEFAENNAVWGYNSDREPAQVGSKPEGASWTGLYDLSGNVWEWVSDWYSETYYGTLTDGVVNPQGPRGGTYHVLRGGSFLYGSADSLRAAYRYGHVDVDNGFRCARSYSP
jgi:formylglycine-generating enzyme required for sulfatase activity